MLQNKIKFAMPTHTKNLTFSCVTKLNTKSSMLLINIKMPTMFYLALSGVEHGKSFKYLVPDFWRHSFLSQWDRFLLSIWRKAKVWLYKVASCPHGSLAFCFMAKIWIGILISTKYNKVDTVNTQRGMLSRTLIFEHKASDHCRTEPCWL